MSKSDYLNCPVKKAGNPAFEIVSVVSLPRNDMMWHKKGEKIQDLQDLADLKNILMPCFLSRVKAIDSKGGSVYLKM